MGSMMFFFLTHRIHGTNGISTSILPFKSTIHVGKYTVRPMDPMHCLQGWGL